MPASTFRFKRFTIQQDRCAMKVGTDGVILGAWAEVTGALRVLDIGTGTGLLALIAAQRNTDAMLDAVEIDDASAEQAAENVAASPWAGRIRVHRMDVRRMRSAESYDVIICNPPFYAGEMGSADVRSGVARHGAELSFGELITAVDRLLSTTGRFNVIIPADREQELLRIAGEVDLRPHRRGELHYLEGRPHKRVMLELGRGTAHVEEAPVIVEHGPGMFTAGYRTLLKDFLLKF